MDAGDPRLIESGQEILDEGECVRLLHTARIGRIVVTLGELAAVFPVNYVMLGSDIFFFTGPGVKLNAALDSAEVTFETDEIDVANRIGWSVLATGRGAHRRHSAVQGRGVGPVPVGGRESSPPGAHPPDLPLRSTNPGLNRSVWISCPGGRRRLGCRGWPTARRRAAPSDRIR